MSDANPNFLNLDDLAAEKREIQVGGAKYEMKEMTVEDFIEVTKETERMEREQDELSMADQVNMLIDLAGRSLPNVSEETLRGLSMKQLNAIVEFARADASEQASDAAETAQVEDGEGK